MRSNLIPALLAGAFLIASPALEARPLPAELAEKERALLVLPDADWRLEVADDRCRLRRSFASDDGPGIVVLEQIAPGQRFDLIIAGPDFASARRGSWFYAGLRSDEQVTTIDPLEFKIPGYDNAVALGGVTIDDYVFAFGRDSVPVKAAIDPAAANKIERAVLQRSTTIVSFELGNMQEPIEALNTCTQDLLAKWGLDALEHQAYKPPRMPKERVYYSRLHHGLSSDPSNIGHKSLLRVRAMINKKGTVTDCYHEYALSSGGKAPNVCEDIRQLKFEPAVDKQDKPIDSVYSRSIIMSEFDPWTADAGGGGRWGGN